MLGDLTRPAHGVADWTSLGVKLPKPLTDAIEALEALRYVEVEPPVTFDPSSVTADNAESKIREFAEEIMLTRKIDQFSTLAEAKRRALEIAARAVLAQAPSALPDVVRQLTPKLDQAAAEFTDAVVESLPADLSDSELVQAGPSALDAYHRALGAQQTLTEIDKWVTSLAHSGVPALSGSDPTNRVMRILRPSNSGQLHALENPRGSFGRLVPHYVVAARLGIEFAIIIPREADQLRAEIRGVIVETEPDPAQIREVQDGVIAKRAARS